MPLRHLKLVNELLLLKRHLLKRLSSGAVGLVIRYIDAVVVSNVETIVIVKMVVVIVIVATFLRTVVVIFVLVLPATSSSTVAYDPVPVDCGILCQGLLN